MGAKMARDRIPVEGVDAQAEMLHVAALGARRGTPAAADLTGNVDEIDQGRTGSELRQADAFLPALEAAADHLAVEAFDPFNVADAQDDMVEAANGEGDIRRHG